MTANKTTQTEESVDAFVDGVEDEERRRDCRALLALLRDVTGEEPRMWGSSMVGFGTYHYRYDSGREGDSFLAGFSPRKRELSIYVMAGLDRYEAELARLGRHRTGKSCLYVRRLADVDLDVLREMLADSVHYMRSKYGAGAS